jgi:CheY-like chemotaxis protein
MTAERTAPQEPRGRVLVVDDDPDTLFIIPTCLEQAGYEAQVAADGLSALAAIRRQRPDVVILDLAMPLLSGPDVLAALKADRDTSDIPVIACTALAGTADVPALLEQGFSEVLLKPVDISTVKRAVEQACSRGATDTRHN